MADVLTVSEVADRLRISRRSVERAIERGEIRVVRIGALVRVPRAELARVLGLDVVDLGSYPPGPMASAGGGVRYR
jgi:excisionase family DNA binding protein